MERSMTDTFEPYCGLRGVRKGCPRTKPPGVAFVVLVVVVIVLKVLPHLVDVLYLFRESAIVCSE
jgi:hypothetical protein